MLLAKLKTCCSSKEVLEMLEAKTDSRGPQWGVWGGGLQELAATNLASQMSTLAFSICGLVLAVLRP